MKIKILSAACYLGFAPQIWFFKHKGKSEPLFLHHIQNGLVLFLFVLFALGFFSAVQVLEFSIQPQYPMTNIIAYELMAMDFISGLPFLVWGVLAIMGLVRAIRKSTFHIPFISKIGDIKAVILCSIGWGIIFQLTTIFAIFIPLRASYLAHPHDGPASVYMLYQNINYPPFQYTDFGTFIVPKWIFATGFYPISEIANTRWGNQSIAVIPLTRENMDEALRNGRLVFLASHGGPRPGTIQLSDNPDDFYSPEEIKQISGTSSNLQVLYIAACYGGAAEAKWKQYIGNSELISFNRISRVNEHIYWLWFKGPKVVSELK